MRESRILRCTVPVIIFSCIFIVGWFSGVVSGRRAAIQTVRESYREYVADLNAGHSLSVNKLTATLALIDSLYVDEIASDTLVEYLLPLLMEHLDPHSDYIPAEDMQAINEPLEGEFDGIGVVFNMATDTVIVLNVIPSGPSDKAGVRNGDRILRINDSLVAGRNVPQNDIVKQLRGPRGTEVKLSLERQNIDGLVEVSVVRDAIPLKSIEASYMIDSSTGYIHLAQFARTSYAELVKALSSLRKQGMTSLVFDLRGNSGGYLDQAIAIANEFLPKGKLIVYTEDRHGNRVEEYSDGKGGSSDLDIAVLVDEASASSSEILAGALQDNDRGTIVGRRTFGKGLVQQQIPFIDGSALRLTVARYYTPTGRSIQKPYKSGDESSYYEDIINRYITGEFFSADSIRFVDSLRFTTPGGKTVYGGGGIMPDIFVPLDTLDVTPYFIEVSGRNILYRYTIEYADRHRAELDAITSIEDLRDYWNRQTTLLDDFVRYAERNGIKPNRKEIEISRNLMLSHLRAYISRNTRLESNGFSDCLRPSDTTVQKAVEILGGDAKSGT